MAAFNATPALIDFDTDGSDTIPTLFGSTHSRLPRGSPHLDDPSDTAARTGFAATCPRNPIRQFADVVVSDTVTIADRIDADARPKTLKKE